ncbi:class I SAM-dependent methyltransferase [Actinocrispum wychmicini]|uniref:Methyltransferase family protein n=1 Tax=Actinocrispum wychmicini TaxID=1213861 RepID=A0A4R2K6Q2_9PSEU|nr:class I SAM-dependent methyltransferase [Actinocrispum wychmicini]TCO65508.1 methyltransferase family protein [Actinocrispum wychmicini]
MNVFDEIATHYDDDLFHQVVAEKLVAGLADAPTPDLVVDIATGTGAAAFAALQHLGARDVVAVDLSAGMIARALEKAAVQDPEGKIRWQVAPAVPAPVPDASADLVVCASSLHFLGNAALKDWLRVLRPSGTIAFSLPLATTFTPSSAFAPLVATDLALPTTVAEAAAVATGYLNPVAHRIEASSGRVAFLVYATAPA